MGSLMDTRKFDTKNNGSDYEIIIVGAGPAGISAWLHMEKYAPRLAKKALVIEKAIFPRDKLCGGGVGAWSPSILKHLEIELDIPSLFVSDVEFRFGDEIHRSHQPNCFRLVQRIDFDHALVKAAVDRGLELHEGEKLLDVIRDRNRLIVKTSRGKYSVQALVGADGALSMVRRKMMPVQEQHLARTVQIYAPVDPQYDTEFEEKKVVLDFTPVREGLQGYVYHFPCLRNGIPTIAHGTGDVRIYPDKPRADLKKIFSRELQLRNIHRGPEFWSSHPIRWLSREDIISQPNVLLAGDAAGIEPAFGGGIHIALSYGEVTARAMIDAFEKNDFSFHDYKQRVYSHFMGQYIQDCTHAAMKMYGGEVNPLHVAREFFSTRNQQSDLIHQMFSELIRTLRGP